MITTQVVFPLGFDKTYESGISFNQIIKKEWDKCASLSHYNVNTSDD
jgi:hypothetical protein